jgi:hypothetical protein
MLGALPIEQIRALARLQQKTLYKTMRYWKDSGGLLLRWQAAPGLDAAFQLVAGRARICDRTFWICTNESQFGTSCHPDVGFLGMQYLPQLAGPIILCEDLTLVLRCHCRQARYSFQQPPPVLGWQMPLVNRRLPHSWLNLLNRPLTFWSPDLTPQAVIQACRVNGLISRVGPRQSSRVQWQKFFSHYGETDALIQAVRKEARPWRDALISWVRQATDLELRQMEEGMQTLGQDLKTLTQLKTGTVLYPVCRLWTPNSRKSTSVEELHGRWYEVDPTTKARQLLFDGTIRLHKQVLIGPDLYRFIGEVHHQQKIYPFRIEAENRRFRVKLQRVMNEQAGPQLPKKLDLPEICAYFSNTHMIEGLARVGWDGHGYRLPTLDIAQGHVWHHDPDRASSDLPGIRTVKRRTRLGAKELDCLGHLCPETEVAWCLVLGLVRSLYASRTFASGLPLLLTGTGLAQIRGAVQGRLGIPVTTTDDLYDWPHGWPRLISSADEIIGKFANLVKGANNQHLFVFLPSTLLAYLLLADQYGTLLDCRQPLDPNRLRHFPFEKLVLALLQRLTRHEPEVMVPDWEQILGQAAGLAEALRLPTAALTRSSRWIVSCGQPKAYRQLVLELHLAGLLESSFSTGKDLVVDRTQLLASLRRLTPLLTSPETYPDRVRVPARLLAAAAGQITGEPTDGFHRTSCP